jgi:hypothetical protein
MDYESDRLDGTDLDVCGLALEPTTGDCKDAN